MTPDDAVETAQHALTRNDLPFTSELHKSAAHTLLQAEMERTAFLLKLAFNYVENQGASPFVERAQLSSERIHYCAKRLTELEGQQ